MPPPVSVAAVVVEVSSVTAAVVVDCSLVVGKVMLSEARVSATLESFSFSMLNNLLSFRLLSIFFIFIFYLD